MLTKRRQSHTFYSLTDAQVFMDAIYKSGGEDVTLVVVDNKEDKARGYAFPRLEYVKVHWTEESTD